MDCSCPSCQSKAIKKNGYTRHGKQNHRCLDCGRQFSLEPPLQQQPAESTATKDNAYVECRVIG